jgi:phospholipid/cholesterol/gamma-HCH transport system substrate-binding protein
MRSPDEDRQDPHRAPAADRDAEWLESLPARKRGREAWVGLFVVAAVLATLTALFTLTDASLFRGRYETLVRVDQASGIRRGDPVQLRGVNIGRVKNFIIEDDGVLVRLEIEGEYPIPADSRVQLVSGSLLGGMSAHVIPGNAEERAGRDDVLEGSVAGGMMDTAADLGGDAEVVLQRMQALLDPGTVDALGTGAVELRDLLTELSALAAEERESLRALTASLRRSAEGIEGATTGPELERVIAQLDAMTADAAETAAASSRAASSLETVLGRLERGEGTLGRLSADPALYYDLQSAAAAINALVEDIRANPRRYINLRVF